MYLAEEAIGLVKSLNWSVVTGPSLEFDEERVDEEIINELREIDDQELKDE